MSEMASFRQLWSVVLALAFAVIALSSVGAKANGTITIEQEDTNENQNENQNQNQNQNEMSLLQTLFGMFSGGGPMGQSSGKEEHSAKQGPVGVLESLGYTRGDQSWCIQRANKFMSNGELLPFGVLPGTGWDNLQNKATGQVIAYNFSKCKTTDDGKYLIPDNSFTVPIKTSSISTSAEIISDYLIESSSNARSINVGAKGSYKKVVASGSFSDEHMKMKTRQLQNDAITVRVKATYIKYKIELNPDPKISKVFHHRIMDISESIAMNRSAQAKYRAQTLVRDFGSHYVTSIIAGGTVVKDDYIKKELATSNEAKKHEIRTSASVAFLNKFKITNDNTFTSEEKTQTEYTKDTKQSEIRANGGESLDIENPSLVKWRSSLDKNLVAIDRMGNSIFSLITERVFPTMPASILFEVEKTVRSAVQMYYEENTLQGCTDRESDNFDESANFDDHTCTLKTENPLFGGVYQTCNCHDYYGCSEHQPCKGLQHKNPKTGGYSCPTNYKPVKLYSEFRIVTKNSEICHRCGFWKLRKCCRPSSERISLTYVSYWCAAAKEALRKDSSYLFGGLYTSKNINPVTKGEFCPQTYVQQSFLDGVTVCLSDSHEVSKDSHIPFAGFYSCKYGNPLAATDEQNFSLRNLSDTDMTVFPQRCPEGYSQRRVWMTPDSCQIYQCVQTGMLAAPEVKTPPIRLPPFIDPPQVEDLDKSIVYDPKTKTWVKGMEAERIFEEEAHRMNLASSSLSLSGLSFDYLSCFLFCSAVKMTCWTRH